MNGRMDHHRPLLAILLVCCSLLHFTSAQSCTPASPENYVAFPSIFDSVTVINPEVPNCSLYESALFICSYSVVLGDGVSVPSPPNLNDRDYVENFLAWERIATHPYIDFDITTGISRIELSFLNNPVNNISLPDIELFDVTRTGNSPLRSVLLDNQDLTQGDNQIRTVTVRPVFASQPHITLRISLSFAETYDFDWFLLSEVRFCSNLQSNYQPVVTFEFPIPNTTIQPSAEALREGSTEVLCTVSSQGLYTWQWRKDSSVIQNGGSKYRISVGEGSRTTKLMISDLSFSDAGRYECTASTRDLRFRNISLSQMQDIEFPANLITAPDVAGFRDTGEVVISCELHGYQSSITPPVWLNKNLSRITDTTNKYTITEVQGTNTVVLENGTAVPSLIVRLTIRQLGPEDAGNYTCRSGTEESVTQLTIMEGTAPPTTVPPPTTATATTIGGVTSGGNGTSNPSVGPPDNSGVVAAAIIVTLLIVVILIAIIILLIIFMIKRRDPKFDIRPSPNGNSYISVNKRRLTKEDIKWQHTTPNGAENPNAIYSMIEKKPKEQPPPVPPQNFDQAELEALNLSTSNPVFEDGELYAQPDLKPPRRRLTNSTKPKLAKITSVDTKTYSLDNNPIYESTSSSLNKVGMSNGSLDKNPVYAEPDNRRSFTSGSTTSGGEPIYSEALNPAFFSQDQGKRDSTLLPYGPVYAEPSLPKKTVPPLSVTAANIREDKILGNGQFGEVVLAKTVGLSLKDLKLSATDDNKDVNVLVAVKKLKSQADGTVKESFEKEIQFMSRLEDDNIVRLIAVCNKEPKFLVIEYMENGDLYQFLNGHELATSESKLLADQLPVSILLYMAVQIASGMRYLASLKYVHRDLASRNCLVGKNFVVKISDFGMSRSLYESVYYRVRGKAMLPIRWMATESFYGRFSEKTDIWAFGVTMWEIFSMGRYQPYEAFDDQQLIQDAVRNKTRKLLEKPEACPDEVYRVMLRCWEYKLEQRATFEEVFNSLSHVHRQM